jgi:hypothetical protein
MDRLETRELAYFLAVADELHRPLRDDLITVPMADLPPVVLLLAWPTHSTSLSVAALARAAAAAIRSNAVASPTIT